MKNNVIFGSGITGLLAKEILGASWTVIPFGKSRFYSFRYALNENHIIRDVRLDEFLRDVTRRTDGVPIVWFQSTFSVSGALVNIYRPELGWDWLSKVCGVHVPGHAPAYFPNHFSNFVYALPINVLYAELLNRHIVEIQSEAMAGPVTEIGEHYFMRAGYRHYFERAVSTIPLDVLRDLSVHSGNGEYVIADNLPALDVTHVHVATRNLDLEGAHRALVVDPHFGFYKAIQICPYNYLIQCQSDIPDPEAYFNSILPDVQILGYTTLKCGLPLGDLPDVGWLVPYGIWPVGQHAQWDMCMDVGSGILRLMTYAQDVSYG